MSDPKQDPKPIQLSTFDHLLEGFQVIDREWRYIYVNKAVVLQSKYPTKEDLLGFTMMEKFPGIDQTPLFDILQKCMFDRIPAHLENEFDFPDGSKGYFELRIEPVPEGIFILSQDISERRNAEENKNKVMQSMENMLHFMSHKFRQPVSQILGFATMLEDGEIEQISKVSGYMKNSAETLDHYLRELVAYLHQLKNDQNL